MFVTVKGTLTKRSEAYRRIFLWAATSLLCLFVPIVSAETFVPPPVPGATLVDQAPDAAAQQIEARCKQEGDDYDQAFDKAQGTVGLDQPVAHDFSALETFLREHMKTGSPTSRESAAACLLSLRDYDVALPAETFEAALKLLPATSPWWAKNPDLINYEADGLKRADTPLFLEDLRAHNPDRVVQARAEIALASHALREGNLDRYKQAYSVLTNEYKDIKALKFEIALLNPDDKIFSGRNAPVFRLPSVDGTGKVSNDQLTGKWYLLDFWATWCGPCMGERATLQKIYEKYKNQNLEIISISLDDDPQKVDAFRKSRWSMPWQNAILPDGQKSQTAKDYDVDWIGLPRLVLVRPDGRIAAVQDQLSREHIDQTLSGFLGQK